MAGEKEGKALREYGNRRKRYKQRRRAIIIIVLLLLAVMGGIYLLRLLNRSYTSYDVVKTTDISGANAVGYLNYGTSVIKYSKDGAVAVEKDGNQLWNGSYEMADPIADTCGKYVVIADRNGRSVQIFNEKGYVKTITTDYNIIKVEVASQGVVAILMETENGNYLKLYDLDDTVLVDKKTSIAKNGYPLDFSLSDDGKKLVTSYLSYSGGCLTDIIAFYNYGKVGQNKTDRFVGGWNFNEGIIIPRVVFVNNDTVCAFKDSGLAIYTIEEIPDEPLEIPFDGKVQSILYNSKYVGIVMQSDGASSKKLKIYDLSGKLILEKAIDYNYENISLSGDEIIMNDNISCLIMKINGKIKFRHTFDSNIKAIYPLNGLDQYYLANDSKLMEIKLKEK